MVIFMSFSVLIALFSRNFISVRQVHREFLRAGADVIQPFSFSMDDKAIDEKVLQTIIWLKDGAYFW